jgi:hypothetical protein
MENIKKEFLIGKIRIAKSTSNKGSLTKRTHIIIREDQGKS